MRGHIKLLLIPFIFVILSVSVSAQDFGASGVSSRELPIGLCVVEIDEVIGEGEVGQDCVCKGAQCIRVCTFPFKFCGVDCIAPNEVCSEEQCVGASDEFCTFSCVVETTIESFDLVITETGRKPAFAKVQSLWIFGQDENGGGLQTGQEIIWDGSVRTLSRTLAGITTGVPDKTAVFSSSIQAIADDSKSSNDLVAGVIKSNGIPIASQGQAGEIRTGLWAVNEHNSAFDMHILAAVESPVGNLCSVNLIPVRRELPQQCIDIEECHSALAGPDPNCITPQNPDGLKCFEPEACFCEFEGGG